MNAIGSSRPGPFELDVITRSDHAPTNHERYGNWAQKFYGNGFHEAFKDAETPASYALEFDVSAAVVH